MDRDKLVAGLHPPGSDTYLEHFRHQYNKPRVALTVSEAATILGVNVTTVRKYLEQNKLPFFVGPNGWKRISPAALKAYIEAEYSEECRRTYGLWW